eukprot:GDKJ01064331.1.p1 GENE.GDKJ01064331.1~~GDKJ01064331.1.p1  ORF type:complete len:979 (-),score=210.17 GDKJ01064331.1:750-3653(-)
MEYAVGAAVLSVPYLIKKFTDRPFPFPEPHGCYPKIGVRSIRIGPRLRANIYYPCDDDTPIAPTPYFRDGIAATRGVMRFFRRLPMYTMDFMARSKVYFCGAAPIRSSPEKLPLLVYHHGLGGSADVGTSFFCQMASRGFVVLAVETSCGAASRTILANGEAVEYMHVPPQYKGIHPPPSFCREFRGPQLRFRMELFQKELLPFLMYGEKNYEDPNSLGTDCRPEGGMGDEIFSKVDRQHIVLGGHSFGGSTTVAILDWWLVEGGRKKIRSMGVNIDFKCCILHDPWFEIFEEEYVDKLLLRIHNLVAEEGAERVESEGVWVPTFIINSEYWDNWKEHLWYERRFMQSIMASKSEAQQLRLRLDERVREMQKESLDAAADKEQKEANQQQAAGNEGNALSSSSVASSQNSHFLRNDEQAEDLNQSCSSSSSGSAVHQLNPPVQPLQARCSWQSPNHNALLGEFKGIGSAYKTTSSFSQDERVIPIMQRRKIYDSVVAPCSPSPQFILVGVKNSSHYSFVDAPIWFTWFAKPFSATIRKSISPIEFTAIQSSLSSHFISQNIPGLMGQNEEHRLAKVASEVLFRYPPHLFAHLNEDKSKNLNKEEFNTLDWVSWALEWQLRKAGSIACASGLNIARLTRSEDVSGLNAENLGCKIHDSFKIRCPFPSGKGMPKVIRPVEEDEAAYRKYELEGRLDEWDRDLLSDKPIDVTEEETGIGAAENGRNDDYCEMNFQSEAELRAMVKSNDEGESVMQRLLSLLPVNWLKSSKNEAKMSPISLVEVAEKDLTDGSLSSFSSPSQQQQEQSGALSPQSHSPNTSAARRFSFNGDSVVYTTSERRSFSSDQQRLALRGVPVAVLTIAGSGMGLEEQLSALNCEESKVSSVSSVSSPLHERKGEEPQGTESGTVSLPFLKSVGLGCSAEGAHSSSPATPSPMNSTTATGDCSVSGRGDAVTDVSVSAGRTTHETQS